MTEVRTTWLVGAYGNGNLGDDMLGHLSQRVLCKAGVDAKVLAGEHFPFPRDASQRRSCVLVVVQRGDVLLACGGGLLNDRFGLGFLRYFATLSVAMRLRGARMLFHGIGVEGLRGGVGRWLGRIAVGTARAVTVRDETSRRVVSGLGRDPRVVPDVGWLAALDPIESSSEGPRNTVVMSIAIESPETMEPRKRVIAYAVNAVLEMTSQNVLLVPMQRSGHRWLDDQGILEEIIRASNSRRVTCADPADYRDVQRMMRSATVVAGYRLHATMLGAIGGARIVAVSRSHKVREAFEGLSYARILDEQLVDADERLLGDAVLESIGLPALNVEQAGEVRRLAVMARKELLRAVGAR